MKKINFDRNSRRKLRISSNITGMAKRPRISVYKSNKFLYLQAIDDEKRSTLATFSGLNMAKEAKLKKTAQANKVGLELGKILLKQGVKAGVFDRGQYTYSGRVKAAAEGLRQAGLKI